MRYVALLPGTKRPNPNVSPHGYKSAVDWGTALAAGGNIGIALGASGLCVLDRDGGRFEDLGFTIPQTASVRTSKGEHYYFQTPNPPLKKIVKFLPGWDLMGFDAYTLVPPSVVDGFAYEWICGFEECPPVPCPSELVRLAAAPPQSVTPPFSGEALIPAGQRFEVLRREGGVLRARGWPPEAIREALRSLYEHGMEHRAEDDQQTIDRLVDNFLAKRPSVNTKPKTVRMRAIDGKIYDVPLNLVEAAERDGAKRI